MYIWAHRRDVALELYLSLCARVVCTVHMCLCSWFNRWTFPAESQGLKFRFIWGGGGGREKKIMLLNLHKQNRIGKGSRVHLLHAEGVW